MDTSVFWTTIESARNRKGGFIAALTTELDSLKPAQLIEFQEALDERIGESAIAGLWDAAELINGGADDVGFEHFRAWLVSCGRDVYERALRDHDSLASLGTKKGKAKLDDLLFVAGSVYADKTGKGDFYDRVSRKDHALEGVRANGAAELRQRLPNTCAAYR